MVCTVSRKLSPRSIVPRSVQVDDPLQPIIHDPLSNDCAPATTVGGKQWSKVGKSSGPGWEEAVGRVRQSKGNQGRTAGVFM